MVLVALQSTSSEGASGGFLHHYGTKRIRTIAEGIDVIGRTETDLLNVSGVPTFSGEAVFNTAYPSIDADNEIQVGTAIQWVKQVSLLPHHLLVVERY